MTLKKTLISFLAFGFATSIGSVCNADELTGQKTVGFQTGFNSYNSSAIAGIEFTYRFNRHLRLAPSVNYVFKHNSTDALALNLNMHVPFNLTHGWEIYPYAGLNYSSWNFHDIEAVNDDSDVTSRITRFGLNVGAGVGVNLTPTMKLGVAADYVLIKQFDGVSVVAKIAYTF